MSKSPEAFRTISEVAGLLDVPAHVLRFWETRFSQIRPVKRAGGRRYYRPTDVALLSALRVLLHDQGLAIRAVQKMLRDQGVRQVCALADPSLTIEAEAEWQEEARRPVTIIRPLSEAAEPQAAEILSWPGPARAAPVPAAETAEASSQAVEAEPVAAAAVVAVAEALPPADNTEFPEVSVKDPAPAGVKVEDMTQLSAVPRSEAAAPTSSEAWLSAALTLPGAVERPDIRSLVARALIQGAVPGQEAAIAAVAADLRALRELISQVPGK